MKQLKKTLLWLWLLTKRLYKKPTFLAILVLIPLLVLGYSAVAKQDSGMVTIALAGDTDSLTESIFEDLRDSGQLMQYVVCKTEEEAETLVRAGKADGAWIFPEDLQDHIDGFVKDSEENGYFVRVVQREENVALMLARERLSGVLYPHIARSFYLRFLRKSYPELDDLTDAQLMEYYDGTELTNELFSYDDANVGKTQQVHYLMSPVRGLLAVVIVLGGMATAMYAIRDKQNGTFQWLPERYQLLPELGGQLISAWNLGVAAMLALTFAGMAAGLFTELITLLLYSFCVASFCMLLRRLLGSIRRIGTVIPLLIVVMLLVCPVFFDLGAMRRVQLLLPVTYYVNSVYNPAYLGYMLLYSLVCLLLSLGLDKLQMRFARRQSA